MVSSSLAKPSIKESDDKFERTASILFVDLVASSESASILKVKQYNEHVKAFQGHVRDVFKAVVGKDKPSIEGDYVYSNVRGDEGIIILSTKPNNNPGEKDTLKILKAALQLKYEWYFSHPYQTALNEHRRPPEIAIGINSGKVFFNINEDQDETKERGGKVQSGKRMEVSYSPEGYAINLAKRIESDSRKGEYSSVFVGESVFGNYSELKGENTLRFKQLPRSAMKGITGHVRTYELIFASLEETSKPEILELDKVQKMASNGKLEELMKEFKRTRNPWLGNVLTNIIWDRAGKLISEKNRDEQLITKSLKKAIDTAQILFDISPDEPVWGIYLAQVILDFITYAKTGDATLPGLDGDTYSNLLVTDARKILDSILKRYPNELDARITLGRFHLHAGIGIGDDESRSLDEIQASIDNFLMTLTWEDQHPDPYYYSAAAHWAFASATTDEDSRDRMSTIAQESWTKYLELVRAVDDIERIKAEIDRAKEEENLFVNFPFEPDER